MKSILVLLVIVSCSWKGLTQTVIHEDNFESGGSGILLNTLDLGGVLTGENPWTINDVYIGGINVIPCIPPVPLFVPPTPFQPAGITNFPNSTYLHVTPQTALDIGGLLPAASYVTADGLCLFGGTSTFSGMSSDVSTLGHDSVTFDFWWMCGGSTAYYGELYYSTDGGVGWTPVINPLNGTTQWIDQTTWVNTILSDPNWDNQATLRFGFRFVSGSTPTGNETNPGFSIDDLTIIGYDVCVPSTSTINPEVCDLFVSPSGNYTWTTSDTYMDTIQNVEGCDSIITVNLTVNTPDVTVTQSGNVLTAIAGATYQWVDCANGHIAVALATNQTFAPAYNGVFAVIVSKDGCTDTSECFTINTIGLPDTPKDGFIIQPNPNNGSFSINTGPIHATEIIITDVSGRVILQTPTSSSVTQISLPGVKPEGTYFVKIIGPDGRLIGIQRLIIFY